MKLMLGLLPLILVCSIAGNGRAQIGADVFTVTDSTGHTEKLSSLSLEPAGSYQWKRSGHLDVMLRKLPVRIAWIEWNHIETAVFTRAEGSTHVAVKTTDGQSVQGQFLEPSAKLDGLGDLGRTTYSMEQISTIAHLLPVNSAAKRQPEKLRLWTITDGDESIQGPGLAFRDSFRTNRQGFMVYGGRSFVDAIEYPGITVKRGAAEVEVEFSKLSSLEITGRGTEVVLTKKDGTTLPVTMLTMEQDYGPKGAINDGDMLVWRTPYGFEGINLLPLRRIVAKAVEE